MNPDILLPVPLQGLKGFWTLNKRAAHYHSTKRHTITFVIITFITRVVVALLASFAWGRIGHVGHVILTRSFQFLFQSNIYQLLQRAKNRQPPYIPWRQSLGVNLNPLFFTWVRKCMEEVQKDWIMVSVILQTVRCVGVLDQSVERNLSFLKVLPVNVIRLQSVEYPVHDHA